MGAMSVQTRRLAILGGLIAIAVAVVIVAVLGSGGSKPAVKPAKTTTAKNGTTQSAVDALFAGIPQKGLELGNPEAPATIEEFVDPQCPFCAEFSRNVLPKVLQK